MSSSEPLLRLLRCPDHRAPLQLEGEEFRCQAQGCRYPILDGVPSLLDTSERRNRPSDRASDEPDLSVLVLTRDEAGNIGRLLTETKSVLEELGVDFELRVVDGHSRDATVEEALSAGAKVDRQQEPGYGSAFRQGLSACRGRWILTLDADGSHDPNFLRSVWEQRHQAELVIASRYSGGEARMPWSRWFLSRLLNIVVKRLLSLPVQDLSSGYRLYQRSALQEIALEGRDFEVLIELLTKLYLNGNQVREVPFFYKPRGEGRSKAALLRFARSYLKACWRLWRLRNSIEAADYDARAYHSVLYPQRYWQQKRFAIIVGMLEGQTRSILDVGCGSSKIIQFLPGAVGLDFNLRKLRYLRRYHTQLVHGSVFDLPFDDHSFETVVCSQVIEHIPDTTRAVSELLRVLRPGGRLILGTPDYAGWQWPLIERVYERVIPGGYAEEHITHLTRNGMVALVESLGASFEREDTILKAEWIGQFRKHS